MNPKMRLSALAAAMAVGTAFYLSGETVAAPTVETVERLRVALTEIIMRPLPRHVLPPSIKVDTTEELVTAYLASNAVPVSLAVRVAKEMAEEACAQVEEADRLNEMRSPERRKSRMLLDYLGKAGDRSALPFLEKKAYSSSPWVREYAVTAYVNLAGFDSGPFLLDFVTKAPKGNSERWSAYARLGVLIGTGKDKVSERQMDELYAYLLAAADKETQSDAATTLDKLLCAEIVGYASSIQRQRLCRRFTHHRVESVREGFGKRLAEVESVPEGRRTDLRQRFPLKGAGAEKEP